MKTPLWRLLLASLVVTVTAIACLGDLEDTLCNDDGQCGGELVCVAGRCKRGAAPASDAGSDGGSDGGSDAGAVTDSGTGTDSGVSDAGVDGGTDAGTDGGLPDCDVSALPPPTPRAPSGPITGQFVMFRYDGADAPGSSCFVTARLVQGTAATYQPDGGWEIDALAGTQLEADVDGGSLSRTLTFPMTTPARRRFFWHMKWCNRVACGDLSQTYYFDAAKPPNDFNGDGRSDLFVSGVWNSAGDQMYFVAGGASVFSSAQTQVPSPTPATPPNPITLQGVGDVNGDGYADAIALGGGQLYFYSGTSGGLSAQGTRLASWPLGLIAAAPGDVNRDGVDDFYVVADGGVPLLVRGGPSLALDGVTAVTVDAGVIGVGAAGDVDGDGFADAILIAPALFAVAYGGAAGVRVGPWYPTVGGSPRTVVGTGDVTSDGRDDLLISASSGYRRGRDDGASGLFFENLGTTVPLVASLVPLGRLRAQAERDIAFADISAAGQPTTIANFYGANAVDAGPGPLFTAIGDVTANPASEAARIDLNGGNGINIYFGATDGGIATTPLPLAISLVAAARAPFVFR